MVYVFLGILAAALVLGFAAGSASRRRSLPCPVWLRWFVEMENPFTRTTRASVILEHLDLQPGMTVLDVGCGPGRVTIPLARHLGVQGRVVAMDLQAGMLQRAKHMSLREGLANIEFLQAAAGEGKLGENRFDRALLVTVLGEIPDREGALKEICRSLRAGGILSVTETVFDPHYQTRATVARLAASAGLRERAFYGNRIAFTLNLEKPGAVTSGAHE